MSKTLVSIRKSGIEYLKLQYKDIVLALLLFLSSIPTLLVYLNGQAVNYTSYGLPKVLVLLFLLYIILTSSFKINRSAKQVFLTVIFILLNGWLYLTGFYSLALFFGIGSLIAWSAFSKEKVDIPQTLGLYFILLIILTPLISNSLIQFFRHLSMMMIDLLLELSGIDFSRNGTLYLIQGFNVEIWERCSGYSTSRVFLILLSLFYFLQRKWLNLYLLSPFVAIGLGIFANVLRIYIHLLFSIEKGEELPAFVHELIGIVIFIMISFVLGYFLMKDNPSFRFIEADDNQGNDMCGFRTIMLAVIVFLSLSVGLYFIPDRLTKKLDHKYQTGLNHNFNIEHNNVFQEWAGGGVWILFEHPIQYCYQYYGWQEGSKKGVYYRQKDSVKIRTEYNIGGQLFENRFAAVVYKMLRIDLYDQPIQAEIVITELKSPFTQ